jgi:formylmethanofuran:tetrahydromethanopterin formyltransferase
VNRNSGTKILMAALLSGLAVACTTTDSLQLGNGKGQSFLVSGRTYEQIWAAANEAMSTDMTVVERHKPSGVIKSRVVNGTPGKVVGFFIQPTEEHAPSYTVTIVSRKPLQTDFVDRDWEPSVWEDFKKALARR